MPLTQCPVLEFLPFVLSLLWLMFGAVAKGRPLTTGNDSLSCRAGLGLSAAQAEDQSNWACAGQRLALAPGRHGHVVRLPPGPVRGCWRWHTF